MKGPILDAMKSAKVALDIAKVSVTDAKEALEHIDEISSRHSNSGRIPMLLVPTAEGTIAKWLILLIKLILRKIPRR
jgi:hypothetical protein